MMCVQKNCLEPALITFDREEEKYLTFKAY